MNESSSKLLACLAVTIGFPVDLYAATYTAQILHPIGFDYTRGDGVSDTNEVGVGIGIATGYKHHALLWSGSAASVIDLHPAGFTESYAYATSGSSQVGEGVDSVTHALLWNGTAVSVVDLNPQGFTSSVANDIFDTSQVGLGWGPATGNVTHALLWHGTAEGVVDLHPAGFSVSTANGVSSTSQVGQGAGLATGNKDHALLWHGTAESVVDLHPIGFNASYALGVSGASQVGYGWSTSSEHDRALLWSGSAGSYVDLHPTWLGETYSFLGSRALAVSPAGQVGWGAGVATEFASHAIYWNGTADSAIDLHPFVTAIDPELNISKAYAIADNGSIVGLAESSTGTKQVAVLWMPVTDEVTGDYNGNGVVDAADYVVWRDNPNGTYLPSDYDVWKANYGEGSTVAFEGASSVPEPATALPVLLLTGAVLIQRWRRSSSKVRPI